MVEKGEFHHIHRYNLTNHQNIRILLETISSVQRLINSRFVAHTLFTRSLPVARTVLLRTALLRGRTVLLRGRTVLLRGCALLKISRTRNPLSRARETPGLSQYPQLYRRNRQNTRFLLSSYALYVRFLTSQDFCINSDLFINSHVGCQHFKNKSMHSTGQSFKKQTDNYCSLDKYYCIHTHLLYFPLIFLICHFDVYEFITENNATRRQSPGLLEKNLKVSNYKFVMCALMFI